MINKNIYKYKIKKYKSRYKELKQKLNRLTNKRKLDIMYLGGVIPKKMKKIEKIKKYSLCTFNIWNINYSKLEQRISYLVDEVLKLDVDIICLVGVNNIALQYMKSRFELKQKYYFIQTNEVLSTYVLTKYKPRNIVKYEEQDNELLVVEYNNLSVIICDIPKKKDKYLMLLHKTFETLKKNNNKNIIITGNFNQDLNKDTSILKKFNIKALWTELNNTVEYTENTTVNKMLWNYTFKRIFTRNIGILSFSLSISKNSMIKIIGNESIFNINKDDNDYHLYKLKHKLDERFIKYTNNRLPYWISGNFGIFLNNK